MKHYLIIVIALVAGCSSPKEPDALFRNYTFNNSTVGALIKDYYNDNLREQGVDNQNGVVHLSFEIISDTTYLPHTIPSHYFFLDDVPVVVQTGLKDIFTFDSTYIKRMQKDLSSFYMPYEVVDEAGDTIYIGANYNPVIWKVKLLNGHVLEKKQIN